MNFAIFFSATDWRTSRFSHQLTDKFIDSFCDWLTHFTIFLRFYHVTNRWIVEFFSPPPPFDWLKNFPIFSDNSLTNFALFYPWQTGKFHNNFFLPIGKFYRFFLQWIGENRDFFFLHLLNEVCIFCATDWRISWFFPSTDW